MRTLFTKKMLFTLLVVLILAFCVACGDENVITGSGTAKGDKPTNSATDTPDKKDDDKQSGDKKDDKQPDGKKDDDKQSDDKKDDDKRSDDKKDDGKSDDGKSDNGSHKETYDSYYYLINYYDDGTLYGYWEDGQFVFWPGLWVSFGDDYVQYNWQNIDQNAYSSRPKDSPSGSMHITVFSAGGSDDWGAYTVTYSNDVVKLLSDGASEPAIYVNSDLIDFNGDICAQINAITGLSVKLPEKE